MAIALTILLSLLSLGILAGRTYEILKLTDAETGFFIYKGIVFNPYILIIFIIITICCAVLIFGGSKKVQPFFSQSSKIIALASGVMFLIYGVMSAGQGATPIFAMAGGLGLVLVGIFELKPTVNAASIAAVVLLVVFIAGLSLNVIIFNVNTIYNVEFIKNALSYMATGLFLLFVMKNIFAPSVYSAMLLYITGIVAFVMCGVMNIADIVAMAVNGQAVLPQLFFNAGFGFLGFFAFDNAISVMPKRTAQTEFENEIISNPEQQAISAEELPEEDGDDVTACYKEYDAIASEDKAKSEDAVEFLFKSKQPEVIAKTYDTQEIAEKDVSDCTQQNKKNSAKKFVFTKNSDVKEVTYPKDNVKVVYKRPKN